MATYLVTGGAGFIGTHLVSALLTAGHAVRILDNFSTSVRTHCDVRAEVFPFDVRDVEQIRPAFRDVDGVFHLAALPRVQYSIEHPIETHTVNAMGTLHVLEAARVAGVRRVVFSASSAAYGDQSVAVLHEELLPNPMSPYALQKLMGEGYARIYAACHGIETVNLRYFNVYGSGMSADGAYATVIAVFLRQRERGEPLTVTGDGEQARDFVHVHDVVRANLAAMVSARVGSGEVLNIGSGSAVSVRSIAERIGGPMMFIPARMEPRATLADIRRAQVALSWTPMISFTDGLRTLLTDHRTEHSDALCR